MDGSGPIGVVNVAYDSANELVDNFLDSIPKEGLHQEALRKIGKFYIAHSSHFGFERSELNWIQKKADHLRSESENPKWAKVYEELSQAACVLDAFNARNIMEFG